MTSIRRGGAAVLVALVLAGIDAQGTTFVTNNVQVDQTWTLAGSPYYICYWDCTVLSNVTLTIEPGVTVILGKGEEVSPGYSLGDQLKVQGALMATGATFTSINPAPASWAWIWFMSGSVGRLTNCVVEYGGAGVVCYGLVQVSGATDLEFNNCTFRFGEYEGDSGVHIMADASGTVRFANCLFTNLNIGVTTERDSGVDVEIVGCTFDNLHAYGTLLRNNAAVIRNCIFRNILDTDVVLWEWLVNNWWCKTVRLSGNQFDGGGKGRPPVLMCGAANFSASNNTLSGYTSTNRGVHVGGPIPKGQTTVWAGNDMGYIIRETVTIDGDASSLGALTIEKGNTVRFYPDTALRVRGDLTIEGAEGEPVLLATAWSTRAGNGIWADHPYGTVRLRYANFDSLARGLFAGWIDAASFTAEVSHCTFTNLSGRAFDLAEGSGKIKLTVSDSLITECGESLYMVRGGHAVFSNTDFIATGPLYFNDGACVADFENCNLLALRGRPDFPPITGFDAPVRFRHCTLAGNRGTGVSLASSRLTDCILWGHLEQPIGSTSITANHCCIEGGYIGPGSNNLSVAPGFIGWGGGSTVYVDAAASCPGDGSAASPFCSLADAIKRYRAGYNYGLAFGSPCIGAASDGGNIGADNGVGAPGAASVEIRLAAGTYGLGGQDLLMGVSLIGAGPGSVTITNTLKGLQSGARLEGVTVASTENQGLEICGPKSPTIANCVFSNLTNTAIYICNVYPTAVEPCAPTITAVRIRDLYAPSTALRGIYVDGSMTPSKTIPTVRNCIFHNIHSGASGRHGALHSYYAAVTVANCTFFTNRAGICSEGGGTVTVWNCISYQNRGADLWNCESSMRVGYTDYEKYSFDGGVTFRGTNNFNADPLFVNRGAFDLHLDPFSPCINRGTNQPWMADAQDFDGNPRILNRFVDVGAYETFLPWPMIGLAPTTITVRAATTEPATVQTGEVWNAGDGTLNYTISTNVPWLTVSPVAGVSTGEVDEWTATLNPAVLPPGIHTGLVTFTAVAASNSPQSARFIFMLQAPAIRCSPATLTVNTPVGVAPTSRTFEVWNGTTGTMNYVLTSNVWWLTVTPTSGTSTGEHDTITLDFNTAPLPPGMYSGAVTVASAEATNSPQVVSVLLNILAPYIVRSPTLLTAVTLLGESPPAQSFTVRNGGPHTINYTITTNVGWLTVSPVAGSSTGEWDTITVTYGTAGLPVGTHTGVVTIAAPEATNSPQTVTVRVQVLQPSIVCSPTGFSMTLAPGVAWPDEILRVWNGTLGVMNYTLTTNVGWLSVWPTAGSSTGEQDAVTVSVRADTLAEGVYTGLIVITSAEATNSPRNVPVVVNVLDFNRALNTTGLPWRSGGNTAWFLQTNTTHDGVEAAQSGPIGDNQTSWVEVAVSGPATLSFWWRVSSESGYDFLRFFVDTTQVASISGLAGTWAARTNIIPDGAHVVRWAYTKDGSESFGSDAGWLDEVRYVYDSDGDGLPDLWEQRYWGDPVSTNGWDGDFDGDGASNGDEFLADTAPTNAASVLRITAIRDVPPIHVYFPSSTNRLYLMQGRPVTGSAAWSNVPNAGPRRGVGGSDVFPDGAGETSRLYRISVGLP